jgi:hypothetical protein
MASSKINILFTGDIFTTKPKAIQDDLLNLFNTSDYCIANLEAPITNSNKKLEKVGPHLKQPQALTLLKQLNIKAVSGANNHLMDFSSEGMQDTINTLKQNNIQIAGCGINSKEASRTISVPSSNIKIICTAEEEFGTSDINDPGIYSIYSDSLLKQIKTLSKSHLVVVYAHGGAEEVPAPTKYISNRYKQFIDSGAELIVGHHPHVIQPFEIYAGKRIYYSLGNFTHDASKKYPGLLLSVDIENNTCTNFKNIFLKEKNDSIQINQSDEIKKVFESGNQLLKKDTLTGIQEQQALEAYNAYYKNYLTSTERSSWKREIFETIKSLFRISSSYKTNKEKQSKLMLFHLFRNQSHNNQIQTALDLKENKIKNKQNENSKLLHKHWKDTFITV